MEQEVARSDIAAIVFLIVISAGAGIGLGALLNKLRGR